MRAPRRRRRIGSLLAVLLLAACAAGRADTILVTVNGTVGLVFEQGFWDSTVTLDTPITAVYQIDTDATPWDGNNPLLAEYRSGPAFTATIAFGDYVFSESGTVIDISHDESNAAGTSYTFAAISQADQNGLGVVSLQTTVTLNDATLLGGTSLADIAAFPAEDLQGWSASSIWVGGTSIAFGTQPNVYGTVTSFDVVNPLAIPEPSTWLLLGLGTGGAALLRRRAARA